MTVRMEELVDVPPRLYDLDAEEVLSLRRMADELAKRGFIFEVHRKPGKFEPFSKPLIKSRWTAPLPHSRRPDKIELPMRGP